MSGVIYDVIIIGGSYSGLAAGMALGRAIKTVLIIDDQNPCNRQTPASHNFLTHDGHVPADITAIAKEQIREYRTVHFLKATAVEGKKVDKGFVITVNSGESFRATNLVFATGIKDMLPPIEGIADAWGISVLHCPFCHGYEVRETTTGVLANGDTGFEFTRLIANWTNDLILFTNGSSALTGNQQKELEKRSIKIVETTIAKIEHHKGYIQTVVFKDDTFTTVNALYAPVPFEQHCKIPESLGCQLTEEGYIKTDEFHETTVSRVYAIGDNSSKMRTLANAVAAGTGAGMALSKRLILGSQ